MPSEQLDLLSRSYPSLRATKLTMTRVTPRPVKTKNGVPPARYSVRDPNDVEVGAIFDPGPGAVQWYTGRGGGRAQSPSAAFEAIKQLLGASR
jgi:hypothetical protein